METIQLWVLRAAIMCVGAFALLSTLSTENMAVWVALFVWVLSAGSLNFKGDQDV